CWGGCPWASRRYFALTSTPPCPPPPRPSPASPRRHRGSSSSGTPPRPDGFRTGHQPPASQRAAADSRMTVIVNRRSDFSLDNFRRVAFGQEGGGIGPAARAALAAARRRALARAASG